jgi:hypothetical protein
MIYNKFKSYQHQQNSSTRKTDGTDLTKIIVSLSIEKKQTKKNKQEKTNL